jgi:hypothetical protein
MVWPMLLRGVHDVFDFCSSSDEQFKMITRTVPKEQNSLPMAIDVEWDGVPRTPSQRSCHNIGKIKRRFPGCLLGLKNSRVKFLLYIRQRRELAQS